MVDRFLASDENVDALSEAAPDLGLKVKAGEMTVNDAWRELTARRNSEEEEEVKEEEEINDTEFILERIKAAYELVAYYSNCKPREVAGFIDREKRSGVLAKKTKRLGNWLKDLGYWLDQGR
jgi:hypothetical protein